MISGFGKGGRRVDEQRDWGSDFGVYSFSWGYHFEQIQANRLVFRLVESEKRGIDPEKLVRCFAMMLRHSAVMATF
jgi:hypothetical protein